MKSTGQQVVENLATTYTNGDEAQLRQLLAARDKTIAALIRRVYSAQTGEDSGLQLFRGNALLQKTLDKQTAEISQLRQTLALKANEEVSLLQYQAQLERNLAEASRVEAMGRLAGGIAHEINTPCQYVGDNLRFIADNIARLLPLLAATGSPLQTGQSVQSGTGSGSLEIPEDLDFLLLELPTAIQQSIEGMEHIASIVRSMKELCHRGNGEKFPVDINHCLQTAVNVSRSETKYVAEVKTDFAADLPRVPGIAAELGQVFLNLIINAAHAIEDKLGSHPGQQGQIHLLTRFDDEHVVIEIRDNGCGMPAEVRQRIFEPFFTTKREGRGSGQGLPLVHSFVNQRHQGRIEVESEVQVGSTFRILLPVGQRLTNR